MAPAPSDIPLVLTIGHSTHALNDFIRMLQGHDVTLVADVRTVPRSRHNPQFNRDTLPQALAAVGIGYVHLADLGGWRSPGTPPPTRGGAVPAFKGTPTTCLPPSLNNISRRSWSWPGGRK